MRCDSRSRSVCGSHTGVRVRLVSVCVGVSGWVGCRLHKSAAALCSVFLFLR